MLKKLALGTMSALILLSACSVKEDREETVSEAGEKTVTERIEPRELAEALLEERSEAIYQQTSASFQAEIPFEDFEELLISFNQGVTGYELQSEVPIQSFTHYTWIDKDEMKGIDALFAEDGTIEQLFVLQLEAYSETDEQFTKTEFILPIQEEWFTFWGGTNELVNYHYALESQRYAVDLLIMEEESTYEGDPAKNESYHAFGKEVIAPADGVVIETEATVADNEPVGEMNSEQPLGNYVLMEHEHGEYSVIAHLQQDSLHVSEGDEVRQGEVIGLSGNSGNSSEAHIHFQVNDSSDLEAGKSIRIRFKDQLTPIKGDYLQPQI